MSIHALRSSFNSGEISPLLDARVDSEKYSFSCRRLENFVPKIYGGAFRRPGMIYLGDAHDETAAVMGIAFNVSASVRYYLEFGDSYVAIWNSDGTRFLDDADDTVVLTTPYGPNDLFDIQVSQVGNFAYFTHPNYPVQKLVRSLDTDTGLAVFAWSAVTWFYKPFRDINKTAITATPSGTTGTITIPFSADIFTEAEDITDYYGSSIQITQRVVNSFIDIALSASETSAAISVLGTYTMTTIGNWNGEIYIERQDDAGNWSTAISFTSRGGTRVIVYEGEEEKPVNIRIRWVRNADGSNQPRVQLELDDSRRIGIVTINSISYSMGLPTVTGTVTTTLAAATATTDWALEAFAAYSGYPRSVTFHEQRLWFGGTILEPNTFWGSAVNDFEDFRRGVYDADSVAFTLAAQEGSAIQSMLSHESLILFTQTEEWTASTSQQTAITPSNIFVRRQSRFGSAFRQAFVALNNILFLQRGSRKLREFSYSTDTAGGQSQDLSRWSEHITLGGIQQIAYQAQPDPVIWCITKTGTLLSLTFEASEGVIAWAKHPTDGTVESVAVVYGEADGSDEVWLVVNRTIEATTRRYIERLDPNAQQKLDTDDLENLVYVDSAVVTEFDPADTTVTGLDHLEGETVVILADGYRSPDQVVTGGEIELPVAASNVVVGLGFTSLLQPSKFELQLQDGTAQGRKWICKRISLNLWKSLGLKYSDAASGSDYFPVPSLEFSTPMGSAQPLFTGMIDLSNMGSHADNVNVTLKQDGPFPANILGMVAKFDVEGN